MTLKRLTDEERIEICKTLDAEPDMLYCPVVNLERLVAIEAELAARYGVTEHVRATLGELCRKSIMDEDDLVQEWHSCTEHYLHDVLDDWLESHPAERAQYILDYERRRAEGIPQ